MSPRLRPAGLLLLLCGCAGTQLVFVNAREGLAAPYPERGGVTCDVPAKRPTVDQLLEKGDDYRNTLLATSTAPDRSDRRGPYESEQQVAHEVKRRQAEMTARVQRALARFKQAQACYDAALEQDPGQSYAYLSIAVINLRMYDFDADLADREHYYANAAKAVSRAAEINKYDAQALYYDAELKVRKQRWEEAEAKLQLLVDKGWDRAHVHNLLGFIYASTGRPEKAHQEWLAATQVNKPPEANAWAVQKTRPIPPAPPGPIQFQPAKATFRWNEAAQKPLPASPPPLPGRCVWLENGATQC